MKNTDLFKICALPFLITAIAVGVVFIWVLRPDEIKSPNDGKYIGRSVYRLEYEGKVYLVHARGGILEHQTNTP